MPDWMAIAAGCATTLALVEVIRRMRRTSRAKLADDLDQIAASLAAVADDLDQDRSSPAQCAELHEQLDGIRTLLENNSLVYGVRHDLIVALAKMPDEPTQYTADQLRAGRLALEVEKQLQAGTDSIQTDKMRRVSRLFKGAADAMKAV
jgi:small-conductance mechanosensitive channel